MTDPTTWFTLQEDGPLATLTLNRPEQGNALNGPFFDRLAARLNELAASNRSTVLLVRAVGQDFCIGRERPSGPPPTKPSAEQIALDLSRIQRTNEALMAFPGISIAAVQGRALGAGASLAGRCDVVLAASDARLGFPEIHAALPPTIVMAYYGYVLPPKPFLELIVTGREMDAAEAQRIGLVTRVVPADLLQAEARAFADQLLQRDADALRVCKAFFRRLHRMQPEEAADYGINILANLLSSR